MGIKYFYPIDSYKSIEKCLSLGADGTEIDVQMTKDNVLIAYHNSNLDDNTQCNGIINDKNWPEIENCTYKLLISKNPELISLEKLFSSIENLHNYIYTFDCIFYTNTNNTSIFYDQFANALIKIIDKYSLEENVFIESRGKRFLKIMKNKKPNYKLFIYPSSFESGMEIATELNLYGISISTPEITKEDIEYAHSSGFRVALWNVNTKKRNIEAIEKSPDFIQTDNVKYLLGLIK